GQCSERRSGAERGGGDVGVEARGIAHRRRAAGRGVPEYYMVGDGQGGAEMNALSNIKTITKRELGAYFSSPVAYVFIVIFLLLAGFFTFMIGGFFERGEASLISYFPWHPWLYLFLVPAVGMRLWSEERRLGTMEFLLTLPI